MLTIFQRLALINCECSTLNLKNNTELQYKLLLNMITQYLLCIITSFSLHNSSLQKAKFDLMYKQVK